MNLLPSARMSGSIIGTLQLSSKTLTKFFMHLKLKSGTPVGQKAHALICFCPLHIFIACSGITCCSRLLASKFL